MKGIIIPLDQYKKLLENNLAYREEQYNKTDNKTNPYFVSKLRRELKGIEKELKSIKDGTIATTDISD